MAIAAPDIFLDEHLVRRLVRSQHPDLGEQELRLVANGWDNDLYRLGDDLVVRLPRRKVAVPLIANEQRWLPSIAERVSVAVPTPVRVGVASDEFPWPWTITPWFEGTIASNLSVEAHDSLASDLAEFVRQLHIPAPEDAPANPFRGVPLAEREVALLDRLASGLVPRIDEVERAWQRATGWALLLAGAFLANSHDSPAMLEIGLFGIAQVLQTP